MSLKRFRQLVVISIIVFLISSIFTGVKIPPFILKGKLIERGYYETFIFLITASIVLSFILLFTFILEELPTRKSINRGLKIMGFAVSVVSVVSVLCDFSALFNTNNLWSDAEYMFFLILAMPSTVAFSIGLLMLIYGLLKSSTASR